MPTRVKNATEEGTLTGSDLSILGTPLVEPWLSILDSMPVCVAIHSVSGELRWPNRALCELYGKSREEMLGLSCDEFFDGHTVCPHEQVVATGKPVQLNEDVHINERDLSVSLEALRDEGGSIAGYIIVMRDVTGERRTQKHLMTAERFALLGQLLAGVAHDVGTPLNVISGYAEFLLMRTSPEGQGYKELSAILEQTRRIAAVFGHALDLARPPQGRADAIEIKAMLTDSLDLVRHHLRRADVKASVTCRISPPLIYGEAVQLRQAFFNLLLNGSQLVGSGGTLQIVIDEAPEMSGFLDLTLIGTETSGIAHDFSRSFAFLLGSPAGGETPAVGLYMSKRILDAAGARIAFKTAEEGGVGLTIYLPMKPSERT